MNQIIMTRVSDTEIVISGDDSSRPVERSTFKEITDPKEQFLVALADYLGFDSCLVLNIGKEN